MANFLCGTALVSSIDAKFFLIVPLAKFDFAPHDVRVMTDEAENRRDLPTKENIVRRPCKCHPYPQILFSWAR
jgi:hypothetical protein